MPQAAELCQKSERTTMNDIRWNTIHLPVTNEKKSDAGLRLRSSER